MQRTEPGNFIDVEKLGKFAPKTDRWILKDPSILEQSYKIKTELKRIKEESKFLKSIKSEKNKPPTISADWDQDSDDSLPEGWKVRRGEGEFEMFLTAERVQVTGRLKAIEYMIKADYDESEISKLRCGLKRFGWETDPNLPPGYLKKDDALQSKVFFISPDNEKMVGYAKLLEHLMDRDFGFEVFFFLLYLYLLLYLQVTGPVARAINWGKLTVERRRHLQERMNQQMKREQGDE